MAVNVEREAPAKTQPIKEVVLTSTALAGTLTAKPQDGTSNITFDVVRSGSNLGGQFSGFLGAFRKQDIKVFANALLELVK